MNTQVNKKASEAAKAWRLANPERYREYQRMYRRRKRTEVNEIKRINGMRTVDHHLDDAQFKELWDYQQGKCKLCSKYRSGKKLQVIFNMKTDRAHFLLCDRCSVTINVLNRYFGNPNLRQQVNDLQTLPDFEFSSGPPKIVVTYQVSYDDSKKETGLPDQLKTD